MAKKATYVVRNLEKETEAAKTLIEHLGAITPEGEEKDQDLNRDMIEGETNLFKALDRGIELIAMDEAHVDGLAALVKSINERSDRKKRRIEMVKAAILNALESSGLPTHEGALATITAAKEAPKSIITDESALPAKFFETPPAPEPVLKKKAVLDYLKERRDALEAVADLPESEREAAFEKANLEFPPLEGATLSNGGLRLTVRFK